MARITPTIGRKLYYVVVGKVPADVMFSSMDPNQPFDATVIYVWPNGNLVNLMVIDHVGHTGARHSVPLLQEDDPIPAAGAYAKWMPYQVGQAAKDTSTQSSISGVSASPAPAPAAAATLDSSGASAPTPADPAPTPTTITTEVAPTPEVPPVAAAAPLTVASEVVSSNVTPNTTPVTLDANASAEQKPSETPAPVAEIPVLTDVIQPAKPVAPVLFGFGSALIAVKGGQKVSRQSWPASVFVYYVPAASYPAQTGVAKETFGENAMVPYMAYLAIKRADNQVCVFIPGMDSMVADDWHVA